MLFRSVYLQDDSLKKVNQLSIGDTIKLMKDKQTNYLSISNIEVLANNQYCIILDNSEG